MSDYDPKKIMLSHIYNAISYSHLVDNVNPELVELINQYTILMYQNKLGLTTLLHAQKNIVDNITLNHIAYKIGILILNNQHLDLLKNFLTICSNLHIEPLARYIIDLNCQNQAEFKIYYNSIFPVCVIEPFNLKYHVVIIINRLTYKTPNNFEKLLLVRPINDMIMLNSEYLKKLDHRDIHFIIKVITKLQYNYSTIHKSMYLETNFHQTYDATVLQLFRHKKSKDLKILFKNSQNQAILYNLYISLKILTKPINLSAYIELAQSFNFQNVLTYFESIFNYQHVLFKILPLKNPDTPNPNILTEIYHKILFLTKTDIINRFNEIINSISIHSQCELYCRAVNQYSYMLTNFKYFKGIKEDLSLISCPNLILLYDYIMDPTMILKEFSQFFEQNKGLPIGFKKIYLITVAISINAKDALASLFHQYGINFDLYTKYEVNRIEFKLAQYLVTHYDAKLNNLYYFIDLSNYINPYIICPKYFKYLLISQHYQKDVKINQYIMNEYPKILWSGV